MPSLIWGGAGLVLVVGGLYVWFRRWSHHQLAVSRIPELAEQQDVRRVHVPQLSNAFEAALPWVLGITSFFLALVFLPLGVVFAASLGFLFWVVGLMIVQSLVSRRTVIIESQLAEAIDHIVTSLQAGVGAIDALGRAEEDARRPLKPHLAQFVLRLRLGDDPPAVCREMAEILPLESFRLFYYAMGVQWEGGGNLAPSLATTGRFIRDRVELGRRVRAQTTEARFSVIAILVLTYFLGALMWNMDPDRVEGFLSIKVGQYLAAFAIFMQALGAVWIARMARIKY